MLKQHRHRGSSNHAKPPRTHARAHIVGHHPGAEARRPSLQPSLVLALSPRPARLRHAVDGARGGSLDDRRPDGRIHQRAHQQPERGHPLRGHPGRDLQEHRPRRPLACGERRSAGESSDPGADGGGDSGRRASGGDRLRQFPRSRPLPEPRRRPPLGAGRDRPHRWARPNPGRASDPPGHRLHHDLDLALPDDGRRRSLDDAEAHSDHHLEPQPPRSRRRSERGRHSLRRLPLGPVEDDRRRRELARPHAADLRRRVHSAAGDRPGRARHALRRVERPSKPDRLPVPQPRRRRDVDRPHPGLACVDSPAHRPRRGADGAQPALREPEQRRSPRQQRRRSALDRARRHLRLRPSPPSRRRSGRRPLRRLRLGRHPGRVQVRRRRTKLDVSQRGHRSPLHRGSRRRPQDSVGPLCALLGRPVEEHRCRP